MLNISEMTRKRVEDKTQIRILQSNALLLSYTLKTLGFVGGGRGEPKQRINEPQCNESNSMTSIHIF